MDHYAAHAATLTEGELRSVSEDEIGATRPQVEAARAELHARALVARGESVEFLLAAAGTHAAAGRPIEAAAHRRAVEMLKGPERDDAHDDDHFEDDGGEAEDNATAEEPKRAPEPGMRSGADLSKTSIAQLAGETSREQTNVVALLWIGEYADRNVVGIYASRALAEAELLRMTLADARPVAPEIEEWLINR